MRRKLTPYQRIIRAGKNGTGVRISAEEVALMVGDTAISDLAWNDDEDALAAGESNMEAGQGAGGGGGYEK